MAKLKGRDICVLTLIFLCKKATPPRGKRREKSRQCCFVRIRKNEKKDQLVKAYLYYIQITNLCQYFTEKIDSILTINVALF